MKLSMHLEVDDNDYVNDYVGDDDDDDDDDDQPEPIHQLGTHLCELFLRSGKAKILIVGHHPSQHNHK